MRASHAFHRRVVVGALAGSLLLAVVSGPTVAARSYTLDLGRRADFVAQTNFVQCVGASMQMMINMIEPGRDRTARTQRRLQKLARAWSGPRPDGLVRQGAGVAGWVTALNIVGAGPYRLVGAASLSRAMRMAARAMRETGKPVGLLMWQGRHAWVMSGFRATADPRISRDFRVTGVMVEDPLYPHGSTVWGPSPKPGEVLSLAKLGRQFVPRRTSPRWLAVQPWNRDLNGKYVLVLPFVPDHSTWVARVS